MADSLVWKGVRTHVYDIVACERLQQVGVITACLQLLGGQLGAKVEIVRRDNRVRFEHTSARQFRHAPEVRPTLAWRKRGDLTCEIFSC